MPKVYEVIFNINDNKNPFIFLYFRTLKYMNPSQIKASISKIIVEIIFPSVPYKRLEVKETDTTIGLVTILTKITLSKSFLSLSPNIKDTINSIIIVHISDTPMIGNIIFIFSPF